MSVKDKFDYGSIDAGYYDRVFHKKQGPQSKWHHVKFRFLKEKMGDYNDHLDVGCGPGTFVGLLDSGKKSVGVDIAQEQIIYAREHYETPLHTFVHIQAGQPFPFADHSFDLVTMVELIEHLPYEDTLTLLTEVKRVLKPGGRVLITTPNYASFWPILEFFVNKFSELSYQDQHITFYKKPILRNLLKDSGFQNEHVQSFQFLSAFAAFIHWNFSDFVYDLEKPFIASWFGSLLFGEAKKS
ncbi:MAG: class I SAM-dependent methyltransferase [Candidatus Omnitrophica bacterium]|nr:class I SAM-dependent methyltransferase [Candidatus Omnitrophota bacterium]